MIEVAIVGAKGRMGVQISDAIRRSETSTLAQKIVDDGTFSTDLLVDQGDNINEISPKNSGGNTDVVVEITIAGQSQNNVRQLIRNGNRRIVVGTSGWTRDDIEALRSDTNDVENLKVLIVPNFSISAVLQEKWALEAAKFFNDASILEYHHKAKLDKPSGTALRLQDELETLTGTRPDALSVRADGFMATQEVVLTNFGERLIIKQDVTSRDAFMPGVLLAIEKIMTDDVDFGVSVGLGSVIK
ncbi:MAG: hypothetical protein LBQ41_00605 [Candidatus Ancillula sp.]|jgi:4-hydroxy-tetrahydrodipicolinate reductase|nr:hypothetical protein [Candidatus Ancillula sp.]